MASTQWIKRNTSIIFERKLQKRGISDLASYLQAPFVLTEEDSTVALAKKVSRKLINLNGLDHLVLELHVLDSPSSSSALILLRH